MRIAAGAALAGWCATAWATVPAGERGDGDRPAPETHSLVLLVQADGVIAGTPARPGDPPEGASLRLRRVRAGEDLAGRRFRLRAVFEVQAADAFGQHFEPIEGGRLAGPLRAADAYASWTPDRIFHLDAGVLRVPFSVTRQIDEADLRLPERAAFARALTPDFRAGAGVSGDFGALAYAAAVMSSSRFIDDDLFDRGVLVAARLAAEPIGPVGVTPWRRRSDDPWTDWFRFRHGVSFLYGTLYKKKTVGAGMDLSVQWRRFVAVAEYVFMHAPSDNQQGAAVEPGITLVARRIDVVARAEWLRAAGANGWGAGGALTLYAPDPRARLQVGFERFTGPGPLRPSTTGVLRLTLALD
jgi:hypothetical protein